MTQSLLEVISVTLVLEELKHILILISDSTNHNGATNQILNQFYIVETLVTNRQQPTMPMQNIHTHNMDG